MAGTVNVTNIAGVTIVGDGNIVNTGYTELSQLLGELRSGVLEADSLDDESKLDAVADVDGLRSQLQKPSPDREVVARLWTNLERIATAGGLAELAVKVTALLGPLIS